MMDIKSIISKMTLEEKASLLSGKDFWQTKDYEKYGIPSIFLADGPHGIRKQAAAADHLGLNESLKATCFPTSATMANSWDVDLAEVMGTALGAEAVHQNVNVLLGPGINIKRNPKCGRNFEYYSEDPYLAGKMSASYIRGIQSHGTSACVKHFAVNNQEDRRMVMDAVVDERALREIYLTAFEMAVKEGGVKTVMSSYNRLNGDYTNEHQHLLVEILRKEWGFDGVVVTDWGGNNDRVEALKCGNELEMPTTGGETNRDIVAAVKEGRLDESVLDENLERLLKLILETTEGLKNKKDRFDVEKHHRIAQNAAEGSIVLLKNENSVLPIKPKTKVAVIGDFAKTARYQGAGSSNVNPTILDTTLEKLKDYDFETVGYEPGFKRYGKKNNGLIKKAVRLASQAELVLLYIGLDENTETEGLDRKSIRLPQNQLDLIAALKKTGRKTAAILSAGSVVETDFLDSLDALVLAGLGGQAVVGAVLDVLTGINTPCGKLTESYPCRYSDCPSAENFPGGDTSVEYRESIFVGYRYYDTAGVPVRFPFGFGLSYTTFEYSNLAVGDSGVRFTLRNTGRVAGAEIAQLYIGARDSKIFRPKKELKGFKKVFLEPNESKEIEIPFDDYSFRYFNVKTNRWEVEPCVYEIMIGASVADIKLTGSIDKTSEPACIMPYSKAGLPSYFSGKAARVGAEEFTRLYGKTLPDPNYKFIKKKRIVIDSNTTVQALRYSRGWTGRFFARMLRFADWFLRKIGKVKTANMLSLGMFNMPVRGLSRMTGGMISWGQLQGLLTMFNGKFFKGFGLFLKEGKIKKKRIKELKKIEKMKELENMSNNSLNANKTLTDSKASPQDNLNTEVDRSLAADAKANKASAASVSQSEIAATVTESKVVTPTSNPFVRFGRWCAGIWRKFKAKHPNVAQFIVFFILSNGVTVLQMAMMPLFQLIFNQTSLVDVNLQFGRIGNNFDGTPYYMFNYAAGKIDSSGYGGGLAYFLSVQITLGIAQVINFFAQRKITFKANNNPWWAAMWYVIAYIAITFVAAAAQGLYKAPIYKLFMTTWGMGNGGKIFADVITMIINSAISFWVFFPIFKLIFKQKKEETAK